MSYCLIGLGSNLGPRGPVLDEAVRQLRALPDLSVVRQSRWYATAPVGGPPGQHAYLNGVLLLETAHEPHALLAALQAIEQRLGRQRQARWGPRTIDLDLLLYEEQVIASAELSVPHPRLAWRRFVLEPAVEIAPELRHPTTGWTLRQLWTHLNQAVNYLAITGATVASTAALAERLATSLPARRLTLEPPFPQWEGEKRTGIAGGMPLEFLRSAATRLAADDPHWSRPGQVTVSDFWFGQWRAWAVATLPPAEREAWLVACQQLERTIVPPKLLVVLRSRESASGPLEEAIFKEARRPGQGPLLVVDAEDPSGAWPEILAAAQGITG